MWISKRKIKELENRIVSLEIEVANINNNDAILGGNIQCADIYLSDPGVCGWGLFKC